MIRRWFRSFSREKAEEALAPEAFRDLYLAYFRNRQPGVEIEVMGELEFKVKVASGAAHGVYLDNAYQQYLSDPGNRDEILELYITSFLEVLNQEEKPIDPDRIVPVIKDRGWIEEIQASLEERGGDAGEMPAYLCDRYNSELSVFFAEDSEKNIRYLTEDVFEEMDLPREELLTRAKRNLKELLNGVEVMGGDGIYMVKAGGDYEASLLLFDSLWNQEKMPVEGDYVVAIPARDLLIVTGTGHPEAIEKLREMASEGAAQFSYRLSPVLFVRQGTRFEVFEG